MADDSYVVADGTQVHHEGITYEAGAHVPLEDEEEIAYLLNAEWIVPAPAAPSSTRAKRVRRRGIEDKSVSSG